MDYKNTRGLAYVLFRANLEHRKLPASGIMACPENGRSQNDVALLFSVFKIGPADEP